MSLAISTASSRIKLPKNADRLPEPARGKMLRLIGAAEDASAIAAGAHVRWLGAYTAAQQARDAETDWLDEIAQGERRLRSDDAGGPLVRRHGQPVRPEAISVEHRPYRLAVEDAEREEARRRAARDAADEAVDPVRRIVTSIEGYLAGLAEDAKLEDAPPPPVKARVDLREQLLAVRTTVEAIAAEREAVHKAPPADEDQLVAIRRDVAALAQKGRPELSNVLRGGIGWARTNAEVMAEARTTVTVVDGLAALAWLDPDRLIERLHAEARRVAKESGRQPGPPAAQLATIIATLGAQLLAAECLEEAVITALELQNHTVQRREGADVRAVLSVVERKD